MIQLVYETSFPQTTLQYHLRLRILATNRSQVLMSLL